MSLPLAANPGRAAVHEAPRPTDSDGVSSTLAGVPQFNGSTPLLQQGVEGLNRREIELGEMEGEGPRRGHDTSAGTARPRCGSGRRPLRRASGSPGDVVVMSVSVDWAGAVGLIDSDDSDESSVGANQSRRQRGVGVRGAAPLPKSGKPADGVVVSPVSGDWAGAAGLEDSDDSSDGDQGVGKRDGRERLSDGDVANSSSSGAEAMTSSSDAKGYFFNVASFLPTFKGCNLFQRAMFCASAVIHILAFVLRLSCIIRFFKFEKWTTFFLLVLVELVGAMISSYITFHDNDVLLLLHRIGVRVPRLHCFFVFVVWLCFGCFEMIAVKRAWAQQVTHADVLTDMDPTNEELDSNDVAGSEITNKTEASVHGVDHVMPTSAITGILFLAVLWLQDFHDQLGDVIWCTRIALVGTVTLGIASIDTAVSRYVLERYHFDPRVRGLRAGRLQWLYPLAHLLFRFSEILLKMYMSAVIMEAHFDSVKSLIPFFVDYAVGVVILYVYSPQDESMIVHILAGIICLVVDIAFFVDQPGFALPARRISNMCFCKLIVEVLVIIVLSVRFRRTLLHDPDDYMIWFFCVLVVHLVIRFSPVLRRRGDDLHTAGLTNNVKRLRRLLNPDKMGQVGDVNDTTKDPNKMTPLMCAAQAGHIEALRIILAQDGKLDAIDPNGDTCLHFAARYCQMDACEFLLQRKADIQKENIWSDKPKDVVGKTVLCCCSGGRMADRKAKMELLLTKGLEVSEGGDLEAAPEDRPMPTKQVAYSVPAAPCADLQLRGLFPDAAKDGSLSPVVLKSVSALVVAGTAGPLANRLIVTHDSLKGGVPLLALRPVQALGKGGFGKVIEVEVPADATGTFWKGQVQSRHFALKLQLKDASTQAVSEAMALRRVDHPFIVRLEKAFQTPRFLALLLELCPTDLNRILCHEVTEDGRYPGLEVQRAAKYFGQVLLALVYVHTQHQIIYRDVKPENILLSTGDDAKLTDFGLATSASGRGVMSVAGTVGFLAPELFTLSDSPGEAAESRAMSFSRASTSSSSATVRGSRKFNALDPYKMDAFSFGVTLQVALLGEDGARRKEIRKKGPVMIPLYIGEADNKELLLQLKGSGRLSEQAYSLLAEKLLLYDPARRSALSEVVSHQFFLTELSCDDIEDHLIGRSGLENSVLATQNSQMYALL
eukprot:TRINITY_DN4137_c0_g1_i1.p1 TRINITY_DN4137_c0_g1~~TRINITY_DN4137_c0_g1_i1.p1  ORF type:complete len:1167 (-),score=169.73 TRINITY_DN4137_c0_g1_i1:98-3598(-)